MLVRMDHTKVVILILLIIYSTVNCQQNADEDEDMLIDDQRKMNEAAENDSEPLVLSTDLDKQMQANPIPLMPNNEDAEFLEKKTLARLIEALKEKDSMQNSNGGPEIRMQSTGDEPVPLKELMTPEDSMSMSEESSGETPESESKEALEIWENPEVFDQIIGIPGDATEGSTVVQLTAHHPLNLSMDFLCINPQIVICYSDKFANNKYQLRIALNDAADIPNHFIIRFHVLVPDQRTGADMIFEDKTYVLNFSYEADQTTPYPASKSTVMNVVVNSNQLQANHNVKPVFEFMPQFEKDTYDVTVLEGVNEKPMTMAIIYFMSRVNGPAPTFAVVDDTLEWFEIGEITSQQDPNRVLSAVKLMLRKGISAMKKNIDLPYRFMIEAKQADTTAHATVNVDLLSFDEPQAAKDDKATETSATIVTPKLPVSPSTPSSLTTTTANPETEEPAKATPSIVTPKLRASSATPAPPSSTTTTQVTVDDAMDKELQHVETTNKEEEQLTTLAVTVTSSTNSPETTAELTTKLLTEMQSTTVVTESTTTTTIRTTPKQTPPTTLPEIDVSLIVTGAPNGKAVVSELLRNGESVPDLEIRVMADQEHNNELVDLELSSTEAFIIRPRRIQIGGTAQLIVANNHLLDYETYPTTFTVEIRALLKNNHNIVRTEKIKFEKKDELDHAPYFAQASYEFEVAENSVTGEAVGQLSVRDEDKTDELSFELFGENTELFSVNDNVLIVSCKTAMPCLDREQTSIYYFALVATDKAGHSSDPVTITIHVNDKNDNGPKIDLSDDVLRISNGELLAPFVFKVTDADLIPRFTIETDGSAAGFLEVSKVSGGLHQIRPKIANIPFAGNFELELTAKDPSNEVSPDKKIVKVQVKNTISKAHFRRARYERTITTEKIHKGNPLVQLELEGVPIDTVRFVILNNNPGWLSIDDYGGNVFVGDTPTKGVASGHRTVDIGVIDRQSKTILAQTQLILTIIGSRKTESIFKERLYTHVVSKEAPIANAVIALSTTEDKPSMLVISDSITAWNTEHKPEHFPATAVTIEGNNVVLGVEHTSKLRSLQLQVASVEDMSDRALVTVYFSSDPVKVAQKKKQDSKPQFVAPWTPESIVIPVKLVEEAPVGQIAASLPAYDPMTGNRITAVELTGQMADFFSIDPVTQDILVAKRIDFESLSQEMKAFDMELIAGEDEYKTKAVLRFQIIDVDDNMPRIEFLDDNIKNNVIVVMENSPPGTEIARFKVLDDDVLDGNQKFSYQVSGFMHDNFQIREMPEFMVVVVSPAADLDREKTERMEIVIKVTDTAGNSNVANLIITLDDQNDNAPKFLDSKVSVKVTENWQIGSTITRLIVSDKDLNENSRFSFYLAEDSSPYFDVDEDSGVVTTVKNLNGLARIEPYKVNVICKDNGRPQLSAVAIVSVTIVEAVLISNEGKNELTIQSPPIGYVLKLSENTPPNQRIYQVKAQLGSYDVADIKYSLTPISKKDDGLLNIDETSGEIFTAKRLDYETTHRITKKLNKLLRRGRRSKNRKAKPTSEADSERLRHLDEDEANSKQSSELEKSHEIQNNPKLFFRMWIIANLRSLAAELDFHLKALNNKNRKSLTTPCEIKTNLPICIDESSPTAYQESIGCESGYLSGHEHRGSSSGYESTELSPTCQHRDLRTAILRRSSDGIVITATPAKRWVRTPDIPTPISVDTWSEEEALVFDIDSSLAFVKARVSETKYVTTVFQMSAGGIEHLVSDVIGEFSRWLGTASSLLGIACEVHWSVPQRARERRVERRLKDGLHSALRKNNRRVLGIQNGRGDYLPLTFAEASTEENCGVNTEFNNFQGVYRRYYSSLLPCQHGETKLWHQSYWSFSKNACTPRPQRFLKDSEMGLLRTGSVVAVNVLVTARAVFQEGRTDSRLIYVEIIDEDDNEPVFPQNSEETPYLLVVGDEKQKIGKVVAFDVDSSPLNSIYYYLLPSCSNRKGHFSIDHITGEVTFNQPLSALNESRIHLCALASPDADLGSAPEIAFDRHNRSMASITVRTEEQIAAEQKPADPLVVFKNNSHVTLDSTLMDARVPVTEQLASDNSLNYRISNVEFTKAEYDENDEKNKKPISLFSLSPTTGDLHVDTDLITHSEGIYKINVDANMKLTNTRFASLQSEVHYVNPDAKLKFTFDQSRDVMGLNLAEFERKLTDAVRSEGLGSDLTVFLRRPELYKDIDGYNSNKSTACFYVVRNNTILSIEHAVEAISASANSESPLTRLYQVYKVINIERCSDEVASRRIGQFLSPYTIVWITITLVCLLILVAMFGYMCFLTRYRDHLKRKELNFAAKVEKTPPVEDFTIPQFVNINVNQ
ncbi:hypothetical protein QR680_003311 [Steinernema hermaphroditum]|uniref:Cadherin domain-containing protein n=1 Tax=Steinernema hermaphroditum TaxID=289476 RepID=A0AA39H687_9BILA|nr:hypothetical protein QR680_003311 [Steinernema hermaphroditum]